MLEFLNPYTVEGCIYSRGKWYRKGMERKEGSGPPLLVISLSCVFAVQF